MPKTAPRRLLALTLAVLTLIAPIALAGCSTGVKEEFATDTPAAEQPAASQPTAGPASPGKTADVTELKTEDLVVGTGAEAVPGKTVTVNYSGWLTDGSQFDSSYDAGKPFSFALGAGDVIVGWDQGVAGMKVGGKRMLYVPAALGYGAQGYPPVIPANATLVFQVELLGVE